LAEVRAVEAACAAVEAQLATVVSELSVTQPVAASLTLGSAIGQNRVVITAKAVGTAAHDWAFQALAVVPGQVLTVTVTGHIVTIELGTEDTASWTPPIPGSVSAASAVAAALLAVPAISDAFTITTPDVADQPLWAEPLTNLSGGNDASVQGTEDALNQIFRNVGTDYHGALAALNIPDATSATAMAEAVGIVQLASGKLLRVTGENLVELRSLWSLIDQDTSKVLALLAEVPIAYPVGVSSEELDYGAEGGAYERPIVVWTKTDAIVTQLDACQGGGVSSASTTARVGEPNVRPTQVGLTPFTYWLAAINPATSAVRFMAAISMTQSQQLAALDAANANTHVISDPTITTTYGLTTADLEELLVSSLAGIAAVPLEVTLAAMAGVTPTPATGNVSPAWNTNVEALRSELAPEQALAGQLAELASSECVDLGVKAVIATLVAAINAPIDVALRVVTRVQGIVGPLLAKISSLLATISTALTLDAAISCVVGLSISFEGPTIDLMLTKVKFMSLGIKSLRLSLEGIVLELTPKLCQVQTVIKDLISPGSSEFDCLIKALTNALVNALGALKNLLPCIENPFDAIVLFDGVDQKIDAILGIINGMLNGLRTIEAQANALANLTVETPTTSSIKTCQSPPLSLIARRLRAAVGL
jgi:hypothetical protein